MCGEKHPAFSVRHIFRGSPPRVRGKDCVRSLYVVLFRITPACAGKSRPKEAPAASDRDHPRVCGEKLLCSRATRAQAGSPPRVRGKAVAQLFSEQFQRITPACAGKSAAASSSAMPRGDHPRVCGEKGGGRYHVNMNQGSPPRVRGKGVNLLVFPFKNGITPACAGKSRDKANLTAAPWDHPRVCGEKYLTHAP